jgi:hypothetical protein
MSAIDFVIRTRAGAIQRGSVGGENEEFLIQAGSGNDISLNIRQTDLRGYDRAANDLLITLADGRVIVLEGYFSDAGADANRLFLSSDGILNEVTFVESEGGALFAQYGPTETWGKWSPSDELIFLDDPQVIADAGLPPFDPEEEQVSMLAAAGLLGAGGLGAAGAGAATVVGAGLLGGGGGSGGGGGGGGNWTAPTVDNPDASTRIGGGDTKEVTITGTANKGSEVEITIGGQTQTVTVGDDGRWSIQFQGTSFPPDGTYDNVQVKVTDPNGTITNLDGPSFAIDLVAPDITIDAGTVSVGTVFNGDAHTSGNVTISGQGEAGSSMTITIGTLSQTVTVGQGGGWAFTIDSSVLPAGSYTTDVRLVSTDLFGNSTTINEEIQIDTVNNVDFDATQITGDGTISAADRAAGVTLNGTGDAGSTVTIEVAGQILNAVVDIDGDWSVVIPTALIPTGDAGTGLAVTARSEDSAGNIVTATGTLAVDTETSVAIFSNGVEGDGVINHVERADGVTFTGSGEAGSTVVVNVGGQVINGSVVGGHNVTVQVNGAGQWSADFTAVQIPQGEQTLNVNATSTDIQGNVNISSSTVEVATVVSNFTNASSVGGRDGVVSSDERDAGLTFDGTSEPNSTVVVNLGGQLINGQVVGGHSQTVQVNNLGQWSVNFATAQIPEGEQTIKMIAVATDQAGNVDTITQDVRIDTVAGNLTISPAPVEGNDVVNFEEARDGVTLTGTSDPFQMVTVNLHNAQRTVQTNANGIWEANFTAAEINHADNYTAQITATISDAAGNTLTRTDSVVIDTEVVNFDPYRMPIEGNNIINADEASNGFTLAGTSEANSQIVVTFDTAQRTVTTDQNGNWSVSFTAQEIAQAGDGRETITVETTDLAGNELEANIGVQIDTVVDNLTVNTVAGDNIINADEAAAGFAITGQVERGSTVEVNLYGRDYDAVVNGTTWTINVLPGHIPQGIAANDVPMTILATDANGNSRFANGSLAQLAPDLTIDTQAPETPDILFNLDGGNTSGGVVVDNDTGHLAFHDLQVNNGVGLVADRALSNATPGQTDDNGQPVQNVLVSNDAQVTAMFGSSLNDGTHLIVSSTDDVGNMSSTLMVTNGANNVVQMSDQIANVLGDYNVNAIELDFAEAESLTITEDQIVAMTDANNTLVIDGAIPDNDPNLRSSVTIRGAQATGRVTNEGVEYTLGDATLFIDTDVVVDTTII